MNTKKVGDNFFTACWRPPIESIVEELSARNIGLPTILIRIPVMKKHRLLINLRAGAKHVLVFGQPEIIIEVSL